MTLIHRYTSAVADAEGRTYVAEAHGQKGTTGLWEGWIEFVGIDRQIVLRTPIETRQPDRRALRYWAAGLEPLYLEGSLTRAIRARLAEFQV
jgi:hypothetical protein